MQSDEKSQRGIIINNGDKSLSEEIREVLQDIDTDYAIKEQQMNKNRVRFGRNNDSLGVPLYMLLPYIFGAITGCALARLFGGENTMPLEYTIFGLFFAFLSGLFHNHYQKNLMWKYALIRSIAVMLPFSIVFMFFAVMSTI